MFIISTDLLDNFSGRSLAAIESPAIRIVLCGDVVGLLQNLGEALTDGVDGVYGGPMIVGVLLLSNNSISFFTGV